LKILVIPDTQVKPGVSLEYLKTIGKFIVDKKPDVVVHLGDHADMCSLSSYDIGKKSFEGRRYLADIQAAQDGMEHLLGPLKEYNRANSRGHRRLYQPRLILTLGNHENRITRAVENDPKLEGVLSLDALGYTGFGWEVYPFLDVVVVEGIAFSHYFVTGLMGRPCGNATLQLNKKHQSCISGHQQGFQIATGNRADGKLLTSIIAGSCYEHNEDYLGPQGNNHFRGVVMLYDVADGEFYSNAIPLTYLNKKYG
jgi:hypothetical protein